ncbi:MAG: PH domain-containing protein [Lachnospiraceae bacterium]|nr:PH domain-containing protein [Lachnospiraceae bacterium]
MQCSDLELMVGTNETILWRGKPNKKCFLLESIFNPLLPFALIWALIDFGAIFGMGASNIGGLSFFLVPFFLFHLMPVWLYLGGVFLALKKYKNTEYIITDKGIYVSGGTFSYTYEMKPFTDLSHINIHRGIFDQWLGVGDVVSICSHDGYNSHDSHSSHGLTICDISDYREVFSMVKQLQTDIYADTQYPNDLRPAENHGYQTQYVNRGEYGK